MKRFILAALAALLVAAPAVADKDNDVVCVTIETLAAADDDTPVFIAHETGEVVAVGCSTLVDLTTPAVLQFQNGTVDITHATLTCAEAGADLTWIPATGANGLTKGDIVLFDVDNAVDAETADTSVCVAVEWRN